MLNQDALEIVQAVITVDENGLIVFDKEEAIAKGLPADFITRVEDYIAEQREEEGVEPQLAPVIAWAVSILGSWLGGKLINYGAEKFCQKYQNYNAATKLVCPVIL